MAHRYRHTQIGYVIIGALGAGLAVVTLAALAAGGAPLVVFLVLAAALALFPALTVAVSDEALEVWFGTGLIRRRIGLDDIRQVGVVRNPWFTGWGIRWIGRGWLWNVSGLDAVEIELRNGRRFRVGTDDPQGLAAALRRR